MNVWSEESLQEGSQRKRPLAELSRRETVIQRRLDHTDYPWEVHRRLGDRVYKVVSGLIRRVRQHWQQSQRRNPAFHAHHPLPQHSRLR
ncbi:MAG: hypothetical protein HQL51_02810 [Magnetococcales bacterium]|nr:hypothetical protein [Magnetococcales bacterium]